MDKFSEGLDASLSGIARDGYKDPLYGGSTALKPGRLSSREVEPGLLPVNRLSNVLGRFQAGLDRAHMLRNKVQELHGLIAGPAPGMPQAAANAPAKERPPVLDEADAMASRLNEVLMDVDGILDSLTSRLS